MRGRLRSVLQGLHLLPALSEHGPATVVALAVGGVVDELVQRVGADGDVLVVEDSADRLEELHRRTTAPNVCFQIGSAEVLPLVDASVDELRGNVSLTEAAAAEFFRVLGPGGRLVLEGPAGSAANVAERMLSDAGFSEVTAVTGGGGALLTARKP